MTVASLSNAVSATITDTPFMIDLAQSVTNDGDPEQAARWLWTSLADGQGAWWAWDRYIDAVGALGSVWGVMRLACEAFDYPAHILARFVAERIPAAMQETVSFAYWRKEWPNGEMKFSMGWGEPVTGALVLADRAHDLAGLFSVGLKPNGSKDPYALRRGAKHFIIAAVMLRLSGGLAS